MRGKGKKWAFSHPPLSILKNRKLNNFYTFSNQHGFINGKSTWSNILESIDIIDEYLMERDNANIIYLDFRKAFDMESHHRLLVKMKNLDISKKR